MNLAVPPFDDIHVRKALNYAVDKAQLVLMQGGAVASGVFGHIAPDSVENGLLLGYDPYKTPDNAGDPVAAQAQMKLSRYDVNGDGKCDATVCQHVKAATREPYPNVARVAADDFKDLGITLDIEVLDRDAFFGDAGDPRPKTAIWLGLGYWTQDLAATDFITLFDGTLSTTADAGNNTLVGATREQLTSWGYEGVDVPSNVDDRVQACMPFIGPEQTQCWAALDQHLMENVVPWVPYSQDRYVALTSSRVAAYSFSEPTTTTALDHVALKP